MTNIVHTEWWNILINLTNLISFQGLEWAAYFLDFYISIVPILFTDISHSYIWRSWIRSESKRRRCKCLYLRYIYIYIYIYILCFLTHNVNLYESLSIWFQKGWTHDPNDVVKFSRYFEIGLEVYSPNDTKGKYLKDDF